jgi:hypothetical protein
MGRHIKREELQGIDDLRGLIEAWNNLDDDRGPVIRVRVKKADALSRYKQLGTLTADEAEEQYIQLRWGGGRFHVDCLDRRGLICCGLAFDVGEPDQDLRDEFPDIEPMPLQNGKAPEPAAETVSPAASVAFLEAEIRFLREELTRQTRLK